LQAILAVSHQVFAAFCLLVTVGLWLGQLSYPDELGYCKQKDDSSAVRQQPKKLQDLLTSILVSGACNIARLRRWR